MYTEMKDKVAVVTGAAAGMGLAVEGFCQSRGNSGSIGYKRACGSG